jgi:myosin-3
MDSEERLEDYNLEAGRNYRYLRIPVSRPTTKIKYVRDDPKGNFEKFKKLEENLLALDFSPDNLETIHRILAAILLLGEVRFNDETEAELEEPEIVNKIANLLKLDEKKLQWSLLNYCIIVKGSAEKRRHSPDEARDARDVLASTIYNRLVDWIVNTINAKLSMGRAIL